MTVSGEELSYLRRYMNEIYREFQERNGPVAYCERNDLQEVVRTDRDQPDNIKQVG